MPTQQQLANAIRVLSMDAVQKANSGHPGMPMGMADIAEVLWNDFLVHNPSDPNWPNRDRFVLSNGHGSMLLYALLHLSGYALSLDEIKNFRQLHSKTPGHPEHGDTPGVEITTGPLGQGLASAVGMAIAERQLAAQFNRDGHPIIDHYTYVFCGDGCLMEGISHEACSLAGTLKLNKLIVLYDDNGISIDGKVDAWFSDDTSQRFAAYGWQVIDKVDGHDPVAIKAALSEARANTDQPTLICCQTTIGFGSPTLAGSEKTHGAPLGEAEVAATKAKLNWTDSTAFAIPAEIYAAWDGREKGEAAQRQWQRHFADYAEQHPELAAEFQRRMAGDLPEDWREKAKNLVNLSVKAAESLATRQASQNCLQNIGEELPELIGGSADLSGSNNTRWLGSKDISARHIAGNYINYGVREFAMSAIMNGLALHGGFIPYGGTFLVFSDYARNAVRLSALMQQRVIYVYTHDSIGLGEDGPTHQPIEHAAMLRLTPNLSVWRPCDTVETAIAWQSAIERKHGPSALLLSRQTLPFQVRDNEQIENIKRGAYILKDCPTQPDIILIATGSEVALAVEAALLLTQQGQNTRVVSMPNCNLFAAQDIAYQQAVLPAEVTARIAIEAASPDYWYKYVGLKGAIIGIDRFGASAPAADVYRYLNITVDAIVATAQKMLSVKRT